MQKHRYNFNLSHLPFITGSKVPFLRQLHLTVKKYYHLGASSSTWKVYKAGLSRYQRFCTMAQKPAIPASEDTLLLFTGHLATEGIQLLPSRCTSPQSEVFMLHQEDMTILLDSLPLGSNKSSRAFKRNKPLPDLQGSASLSP